MKSFRTELENPIVEKDILELERKIRLHREGKIDDEKFRSLRLARGVYGQRQLGVQMIRIKLPFGKITGQQLFRLCDVADEYSNGNLHITTRQDIQIHYVSLDRTPELWAELERDDITLREACGNTVRNITASPIAGVDKDEPFDVSPYAHALFSFFLRNPICQEMGRKIKISFSSSDNDSALSFIHDLGFIPKIEKGEKGFKVMLAGGLGSQPRHAEVLYEFLPVDRIIPVTESVLRVFDRHGERKKRLRARMKYLLKKIGLAGFRTLLEQEEKALSHPRLKIDTSGFENEIVIPDVEGLDSKVDDHIHYDLWRTQNVIPQKQDGLFAIGVKVGLGNFSTAVARKLAALIQDYAADELRFSLRQNLVIRHVKEDRLPFFYRELKTLGFTDLGYNSTADITACPGTDTCNLGIASSTGLAEVLEKVLTEEYPHYLNNKEMLIKISGCMNACGQHNLAHIGFQGMSIRQGDRIIPAVQILLGGGILKNGQGRFSDKIIKMPSKRGPQALRTILDDFENNALKDESFLDYYDRQGEKYFAKILFQLSVVGDLALSDYIDWGSQDDYVFAIGVGECAGVIIDLVQTLLEDAREKLAFAQEAFSSGCYSDGIYHTYASLVNGAKALLLSEGVETNTQANIIELFDEHFTACAKINLSDDFSNIIYKIRNNEPTKAFAQEYISHAHDFFTAVDRFRAARSKAAV